MAGVDEMMKEPKLNGFQRLGEVCQKSALPVDCLAPKEPLIAPGESFLGQRFDLFLAALYARMDGAMLGDLLLSLLDVLDVPCAKAIIAESNIASYQAVL
jgi:hypothetical protein